jgi:hypothetical protein
LDIDELQKKTNGMKKLLKSVEKSVNDLVKDKSSEHIEFIKEAAEKI